MNTYVHNLVDAQEPHLVGNKARNLGILLRHGLPVPNGVVITTEAFERAISRAKPNCVSIRDKAEAATLLLTDANKDEELLSLIAKSLKLSKNKLYAVRSSATCEDGAHKSFAGQFDTALNVHGKEEIIEAIQLCWASFASICRYLPSEELSAPAYSESIAVIVQEMIESKFSGVGFTRDPIFESEDVYYTEWITGTGDALVGGGEPDGRTWLTKNGKIRRVEYSKSPPLSETAPNSSLWTSLSKLFLVVDNIFDSRQDIEFTHDGKQLYLLQARAITAVPSIDPSQSPPPWVLASTPFEGWSEQQHAYFGLWDEYNAKVVSPLDFTLFTKEVWQSSLDMLDRGSGVPSIDKAAILYNSVPIQIDPHVNLKERNPDRQEFVAESAQQLENWSLRWLEEACELRTATSTPDLSAKELLNFLRIAGSKYAHATSERLRSMFLWIEGEQVELCIIRDVFLQSQIDSNTFSLDSFSASIDHDTHRMQDTIEMAIEMRSSGTAEHEYKEFIDKFIDEFGHMDFHGRPIIEVRDHLESHIEKSADAQGGNIETIAINRNTHALIEELCDNVSERHLKQELKDSLMQLETLIRLRENTKSRHVVFLPVVATLKTRLATKLVAEGKLGSIDDIDLLTYDELQLIEASIKTMSDVELKSRLGIMKWKSNRSWLPDGFFGPSVTSDWSLLFGIGSGFGKVLGKVKKIAGPHEFDLIESEDIVVAESTSPVWTSIFRRIKAIIVEHGTQVSHAAIVARELKLPAIVGVRGAYFAIEDGESIELDSDLGEIRRCVQLVEAAR